MRHLLMYAALFFLAVASAAAAVKGNSFQLENNWKIQSSENVAESGAAISKGSFRPDGWYDATVPSTVLGNLVADGVFKNPFQGRNLDKIPDSIFVKPWWYRTVFELPASTARTDHVTLKFLGINYKAEIWLNGTLIADSNSVVGAFRQFEFDVTKYVNYGGENVLAILVDKPTPGAYTIGFVDWSPEPADHDMGLWRPIEVHMSGDVSIQYPFVATKVDTATLKKAELTVSAQLTNNTDHDVTGTLEGSFLYDIYSNGTGHNKAFFNHGLPGGAIMTKQRPEAGKAKSNSFSQKVVLAPHETKTVVFKTKDFPQLIVHDPHLWWTHDFGKPDLYSLHLDFRTGLPNNSDGIVTDYSDTRFGIRQVNDFITPEGFRGYMLNGKKILIRGGGWADQIFLQQDKHKVEAEIDYAVNMHLNAIRMEGFWGENSDIYNLCDEKGILIMVGFSCQWEWQNLMGIPEDKYGCIRSPEEMKLAAEYFKDQILWLRNHPSIYVWLYGSDKWPRPALENDYQEILHKYDPTRPFLASAAEHTSAITGPTRVKMRGPYDYVPPVYWFADTSHGGAFGFNTETGPGPQVPRISSLKKMLSPDSLWPINGEWYYHCSRGKFQRLTTYNHAIDSSLGVPQTLVDYERKAQLISYDAMRGMYEAFGANKFISTGVIQWMYNSAWPKMWWQLFDYYLNPTGAFYGAQEACMPLHAVYNSADSEIVVVNSALHSRKGITLLARVFNFDMKEMYSFKRIINAPANASEKIFKLPEIASLSTTYFLDLRLFKGGKLLDANFYALSTTPDVILEKTSTWYSTESTHADLRELNSLKEVSLNVKKAFEKKGDRYMVTVTLHNPSRELAFMTYLSVRPENIDDPVLPIFWDENYVSLLPGETRTIRGYFFARNLHGHAPRLEVTGWNVRQ